jgi:hypothetical protein
MDRNTSALRVAAAALALVLAPLHAAAVESTEGALAAMTDREFVEYAHDRFEWLQGEARVTHDLSAKFHRQCRPDEPSTSEGARACEIAKAADERASTVLDEERTLLHGLQARFGAVPRWARAADAELHESLTR